MSVPIRSAGSKSGVNWRRWKPVWMQRRQRFDRERLGQARHAFEQDVAIGEQAEQQADPPNISARSRRGQLVRAAAESIAPFPAPAA